MPSRFRRELGLIVAWLLFPLVPVVLEDIYYSISNLNLGRAGSAGPDPHDWNWLIWIIMLGPLMGYGFLAGATLRLPDESGPAAAMVSKTPGTAGSLGGDRAVVGCVRLSRVVLRAVIRRTTLAAHSRPGTGSFPSPGTERGLNGFSHARFTPLLVGIWAYSWLWPAWSALRRAARVGEWKRSLVQRRR